MFPVYDEIKIVCLIGFPHFLFLFHTYTAFLCFTAFPLSASYPILFLFSLIFKNFSDGVSMGMVEKKTCSSDLKVRWGKRQGFLFVCFVSLKSLSITGDHGYGNLVRSAVLLRSCSEFVDAVSQSLSLVWGQFGEHLKVIWHELEVPLRGLNKRPGRLSRKELGWQQSPVWCCINLWKPNLLHTNERRIS